MFNLFKKDPNVKMGKSILKHSEALKDYRNLAIRVKYNGRKYITNIKKLEDEIITFKCPIDEYEIIRFTENSTIDVELINKSGIYSTELLILEKIEGEVVYYKGKIVDTIEKYQRRESERLPIVLDVRYMRGRTERRGNTIDISSGGMLLETCENMLTKNKIKLNFQLEDVRYDMEGTLLRKIENKKNNTYLYNVSFNNLSSKYKKEITKYIKIHQF